MNILSLLLPRRPGALPPRARDDQPRGDRAPGCGWYDSSHDLRAGLQVREHLDVETLGRELPLATWLELQLQGRIN